MTAETPSGASAGNGLPALMMAGQKISPSGGPRKLTRKSLQKDNGGPEPVRLHYTTAGCNSTEEAKKRYYRLAQENHPDHGGDPETMKAINAEFERFCKEGPTGGADRDDLPEEFIRVIVRIITLDGLTAEIIGRWVWVTGSTYQHKDALKEAGFRWASKKKAWYWHRPEDAVKGSRKTTLESIRQKYGSEVITAAGVRRMALQA